MHLCYSISSSCIVDSVFTLYIYNILGFIYYSDLVQSIPSDLRRKAARLVAAKVTLAARVDSFHKTPDASTGYNLKEEIERKLEKWQEPPPVKQVGVIFSSL